MRSSILSGDEMRKVLRIDANGNGDFVTFPHEQHQLAFIEEYGLARQEDTCAKCHSGIYEVFRNSIHFTGEAKDGHPLPMCDDCHTSHEIARTDAAAFKLKIVNQCGNCHEEVTETYFETYHGKVFALGYTETGRRRRPRRSGRPRAARGASSRC